jgi:hypothetical protein
MLARLAARSSTEEDRARDLRRGTGHRGRRRRTRRATSCRSGWCACTAPRPRHIATSHAPRPHATIPLGSTGGTPRHMRHGPTPMRHQSAAARAAGAVCMNQQWPHVKPPSQPSTNAKRVVLPRPPLFSCIPLSSHWLDPPDSLWRARPVASPPPPPLHS